MVDFFRDNYNVDVYISIDAIHRIYLVFLCIELLEVSIKRNIFSLYFIKNKTSRGIFALNKELAILFVYSSDRNRHNFVINFFNSDILSATEIISVIILKFRLIKIFLIYHFFPLFSINLFSTYSFILFWLICKVFQRRYSLFEFASNLYVQELWMVFIYCYIYQSRCLLEVFWLG